MAFKLGVFIIICIYLQVSNCALNKQDYGVHLTTDSAKWVEKCRAITGTTQEEVDAAAQGMFPESFAPYISCLWFESGVLKPNLEAVPERLKHYWPVKVIKPEELSQFIPCAKSARELGSDVPINKKILEMTKCHYKINPGKYIIF
ncbi:uncharacterized protein LOC114328143 [Diabrotica virgifera virgifera]|uniref:Uncharacterized protein LOC114328143 n=1 Tax=Diabrotica virgifera virgifera TaxID=50390 RepID=A0A6P7FD41_DIAVI|nr:uncharacterized protein LOC114328143 [Diabrotica virgifera virgifera]XP_028132722.1 uncharacterized protein LOC114328143 [Diabrotica virgifera virgifera]